MLSESQQHAIESDARDILCIAGAGSGKTTVLTGRVDRLLSAGVAAKSMLVLTFTRRAAREMRRRIEVKQGEGSTRDMLCSTFHSVCLQILRAYGDRIGYDTATLSVIDQIDADTMLQSTARDCGLVDGNGKGKKGASLKSLAQYRDNEYSGQAQLAHELFEQWFAHYTSERRSMNVLDFGSCLTEVNRLFTECPDVLELYRRRIKWVFVEEAQDTDETQFILHDWFLPSANFFAVADRRQSIYKWRGGRPDLLTERHPNATIIDLRECFRCGDSIVAAANRLIAHNGDTLAQPMIGATGQTGIVETLAGRTDAIVDKVCWLRQAYSPRDIAIIARRHDHLKRIEDRLVEAGIPCERVGQKNDIATDPDFRAIYCCLRLFANPRDDMAFMGLRERLDIGGTEYASIRTGAANLGISHWQAYMLPNPFTWTDPRGLKVRDLAGHVLRVISHPGHHWRWWLANCGDMTPGEAVEWFGTRDIHAENESADADAVTLLTAHAAKGLEFQVVIVAEMNEGSMPSSQGIRGGEDAIAEERRVAYVAMTRAKERLILHYRGPDHFDDPKYAKPPSRFIAEAGLSVATPKAEAAV